MSLHTMVLRGIRRHVPHPGSASTPGLPVRTQLRRVPGVESMSVLETTLALGAIATAVLLNLAR